MFKNVSLTFYLICFFIASGFSQTEKKTVIAVKGDGVYAMLRKNDLNPVKFYKAFLELNKKNLTANNGLYIGREYILPTANENEEKNENSVSDSIAIKPTDSLPKKQIDSIVSSEKEEATYPIFGEKYSSITIEDNKLEGAVYYLISGHGGPDPGALEKYNNKLISEDEYAYDVTLRLARKLLSKGAKVYIIIEDPNDGIRDKRLLEIDYDEVNYPKKKIPRSQKLRLRQRTQAVNKLYLKHKGNYQRLIVTHVDSRSKGNNIDVFFYHHKNSKNGKRLAESIQNTFQQKYARYQPNRIYSGTVGARSNLYVIKNTLPAMVYIELGNIKSKKDQRRILDYDNREAMAKWIAEGLISDYTLQE
ncbi:N-acetylmuramoyl-L-alanine amidase [Flavobacteriaceae bacterium R38]|nr:N-acetylmuramoyl-L-alanine amidase [Flavobacteriaceae bacterium R38]